MRFLKKYMYVLIANCTKVYRYNYNNERMVLTPIAFSFIVLIIHKNKVVK